MNEEQNGILLIAVLLNTLSELDSEWMSYILINIVVIVLFVVCVSVLPGSNVCHGGQLLCF